MATAPVAASPVALSRVDDRRFLRTAGIAQASAFSQAFFLVSMLCFGGAVLALLLPAGQPARRPGHSRALTSAAMAATEAEVLAAARAGDDAAWRDLIIRYEALLRAVAARGRVRDADIADAVQSTWLHVVEHLDTLRTPQQFGDWLSTIADRQCQAVSAIARYERWAAHPVEHAPALHAGPETQVVRSELRAALHAALGTLSTRRSTLIEMLFDQTLVNSADVARTVNMPASDVSRVRDHTLRLLRKQLEREGFTEPFPA